MRMKQTHQKSAIRTLARTLIYAPALTASFTIAVQPAFAAITNQATASGTYNAAPVTSGNSALISIPVSAAAPSLSVTKTVDTVATVAAGANATITDGGDTIRYQYVVLNNGNVTITGVTPVDTGPLFGPAQDAGTGSMSAFTLTAGSTTLAPGQTATFTADYTLSAVDVYRAAGIVVPANAVNNSATATGLSPALAVVNAPASAATTTITGSPLLSITKAGVLDDTNGTIALQAEVGETITYTYTVSNTGNVAVSTVVINDTHEGALLAPGVVANETLTSDGPLAPGVTSTDATANNGTWSVLQPGAVVTFTYVHTVTQAEVDGG